MKFRPGRNLIRLLGGFLAVSLLVFAVPWILLVTIPALVAVTWLSVRDGAHARRHLADLRVTRQLPGMAGRDLPFQVTWLIERSSTVELSGELRDFVPREANPFICQEAFHFRNLEEQVELNTSLQIPVRGEFEFGPIWVRVHGRWGLVEVQKSIAISDSIRIFPESN